MFIFRPTFASASSAPLSSSASVSIFLPLPRVLPRRVIGNQPRRRSQQRVHDAQLVRAQRRAGLGQFHNRVHQFVRLHLRRAPGKFHLRLHAVFAQIFLREIDDFGGNAFALQILHGFDRRIFRHASTQRAGCRVALLNRNSPTSCTFEPFSTIQS